MASKDNPTEQTSTDDAGVHRLRDIVAEEVSLVDRAANKRRFLVVKRSSTMADDKKTDKKPKPTEEQDAAKARARATRAASEEEPDDDEETEKARSASDDENEEDAEEEDEEKAAPSEEEDGEDEEKDEGEEKDEEKADDGENEEEEDEEDKRKAAGLVLPTDAKTAVLQALAQALERLMAVGNRIKDADEPGDGAEVSVPDDLTGELEDVGELLEDVAEQLESATEGGGADADAAGAEKSDTAKRGVTKAGRRMAASRLNQFQKALELLSNVLKELTEERKPPGQRPGPPKKPAAKGDTAGIPELVASVHDLTKIVKRQEAEIVRLAKTRGTSNAIPVDGGRRREAQDEVSWPLDMNRPISRDRVDKSTSFYDDP